VERLGGDRDLPPALPGVVPVDDDLARVGVERFLLPPAFLEQPEQFAHRELGEGCLAHRQLREHVIEVVPAERGDARAGYHGVDRLVELHQGRVKGAAAQVVDQQAASELLAVAELDGRRRRLVEQAEDLESGPLESLDGQEALVAVRVRRHAQHDLEEPVEAQAALEFAGHPHEELHQGLRRAIDLERGLGPAVLERPLQRSDEGPAGLCLALPGRPSVAAFLAPEGHHRREPVHRSLGGLEGQNRIVAAVDRRHYHPRGPEVDPESHALFHAHSVEHTPGRHQSPSMPGMPPRGPAARRRVPGTDCPRCSARALLQRAAASHVAA
jgi:hypothetical protein